MGQVAMTALIFEGGKIRKDRVEFLARIFVLCRGLPRLGLVLGRTSHASSRENKQIRRPRCGRWPDKPGAKGLTGPFSHAKNGDQREFLVPELANWTG